MPKEVHGHGANSAAVALHWLDKTVLPHVYHQIHQDCIWLQRNTMASVRPAATLASSLKQAGSTRARDPARSLRPPSRRGRWETSRTLCKARHSGAHTRLERSCPRSSITTETSHDILRKAELGPERKPALLEFQLTRWRFALAVLRNTIAANCCRNPIARHRAKTSAIALATIALWRQAMRSTMMQPSMPLAT